VFPVAVPIWISKIESVSSLKSAVKTFLFCWLQSHYLCTVAQIKLCTCKGLPCYSTLEIIHVIIIFFNQEIQKWVRSLVHAVSGQQIVVQQNIAEVLHQNRISSLTSRDWDPSSKISHELASWCIENSQCLNHNYCYDHRSGQQWGLINDYIAVLIV